MNWWRISDDRTLWFTFLCHTLCCTLGLSTQVADNVVECCFMFEEERSHHTCVYDLRAVPGDRSHAPQQKQALKYIYVSYTFAAIVLKNTTLHTTHLIVYFVAFNFDIKMINSERQKTSISNKCCSCPSSSIFYSDIWLKQTWKKNMFPKKKMKQQN